MLSRDSIDAADDWSEAEVLTWRLGSPIEAPEAVEMQESTRIETTNDIVKGNSTRTENEGRMKQHQSV